MNSLIIRVAVRPFSTSAANPARGRPGLLWVSVAAAICNLATVRPALALTPLPRGAAQHVIVFQEAGRFAAHPANRGIWMWGDEILVGFKHSVYQDKPDSHSRDDTQPPIMAAARSLDGGRTWRLDDPAKFLGHLAQPAPLPEALDFTHPDFAWRIFDSKNFVTSDDRGRNWKGPYRIAGLEAYDLTSRTDYIVNGPRDAFFFFSARQPDVRAGSYKDRAFTARTTDGGRTFAFVSWMTHEPFTARSVMPSTVRLSPSELVSALRRRDDSDASPRNWIDVYASTDNARSWSFRGKVADTSRPEMAHNGNPPAMVRLRDGRLVVAYGYRSTPFGIRARMSSDNGKTWGEEIALREDARTWDIGYPRMVQRGDGKIVTVYYITTATDPQQHIAATIWDPAVVAK
jgi:hypothetical protein